MDRHNGHMSLLSARTSSAPADLALLLARLGLGGVLIAHGWQKLDQMGIEGTTAFFESLGIPLPQVAAYTAIGVELIGGGLIVLGLLTPIVGVLVALQMGAAGWFAHRENGIFVGDGGWELVLVIGLLALTLAAVGAGRASLDHAIAGPRR